MSLGRRLLFASIATIGFFALLEIALRFVGPGPARHWAVLKVSPDAPERFFVPDPERPGWLHTNPSALEDFEGVSVMADQSFAMPKPPGVYRVFVVGASTVRGYPTPDADRAFPRFIERGLSERFPDRRFEVVNAGFIGIASEGLTRLTREVVEYDPDLIVFYFGHNEFLRRFAVSRSRPIRDTLVRAFYSLRLVALTHEALLRARGVDPSSAAPRKTIDADKQLFTPRSEAENRLVFTAFRDKVDAMIDATASRGVAALVVAPASNLLEPPVRSDVSRALGPDERRDYLAAKAECERLGAAGDYRGAIARAEAIERRFGPNAAIRYFVAQCRVALGEYDRAIENLIAARDLEVHPHRAPSPILDILRREADKTGVAFFDLDRRFMTSTEFGAFSAQLFHDHVHLKPEGARVVGALLADEIAARFLTEEGKTKNEEEPEKP